MKSNSRPNTKDQVPTLAIVTFFAITFAITWGTVGSYVLLTEQAVALFGEISGSHPLFFIATWSPAIAGIGLVLFYSGLKGLRVFFSRLLLWRCAPV